MTHDLRVRIAKALGWTQAEVGQFSLPALREMVRPVDPKLAERISEVIAGGHHITRRGRAYGYAAGERQKLVFTPPGHEAMPVPPARQKLVYTPPGAEPPVRKKIVYTPPGHASGSKKAPAGPASGFGKEKTVADFRARIAWEKWAAQEQRREGHEALAQGHDLARQAYAERLAAMGHASGSKKSNKRVTLKDIPTSQIDFFVGRLHVGTPDEEVVKEIERLTNMPGWTPAARKLAVSYALKRHHKNLQMSSDVMSGRIGRGSRR
jgi:hypothetical protein